MRIQQLVGSRKIRPLGNKQRLSPLLCQPLFSSRCAVIHNLSLSSLLSLLYSTIGSQHADVRSGSTDLVASGKLIAHMRLTMDRIPCSASAKFEFLQTSEALSGPFFLESPQRIIRMHKVIFMDQSHGVPPLWGFSLSMS